MNIIFENKIIFNNSELNREKLSKAVFFDRDGVINEDFHYIKDPSKVNEEIFIFLFDGYLVFCKPLKC